MYPNLFYLFKDVFGVELAALKVVNSFGFFVALSFLAAAFVFTKELRRKQAAKLLTYTETTVVTGKPASVLDLAANFFLGFLFGYKLVGVFVASMSTPNFDPQAFIFSSNGSLPFGLILGGVMAFLKWREKDKLKLDKPTERTIRIWPSDRVGDITIIAAVAGFAGAKLFDNLENWDRFIQDPIGNLFAASGLTFYGGLICATIAIAYFLKKNSIPFIHVADAIAPGLMLAYGTGRIGCQVSGDGDWGIYNSAYKVAADGKVVLANNTDFANTIHTNASYFAQQHNNLSQIPHASFKGFWGLPDWLFAYTYPHNVNKEGLALPNCGWDDYCTQLPIPVFPTPLYEIIMGVSLFSFLWFIRKRFKYAGQMFAIYLVVNGLERFAIESIRVNTTYNIGNFHPTQAQLISSSLVIIGVLLYLLAPKLKINKQLVNR